MANLKVIRDKLEARLKAAADKAEEERKAKIAKELKEFPLPGREAESTRFYYKTPTNEPRRPIRDKTPSNEPRRPKPKKKSKTLLTDRYQGRGR